MKAIVSLFISAYQPRMASIECRANFLTQSRQPLFFNDSDDKYNGGCSETRVYKGNGYKDKADENKGYEAKHFEDQRFEEPDFEDTRFENRSRQFATTHRTAS